LEYFGIFSGILNPGRRLSSVFIILFFTSSHDTNGRYAAYWSHPDFHINETISKFISAGLYTMMGMALVSFVLIILFEVRALFK
jgi:hypothetical protein